MRQRVQLLPFEQFLATLRGFLDVALVGHLLDRSQLRTWRKLGRERSDRLSLRQCRTPGSEGRRPRRRRGRHGRQGEWLGNEGKRRHLHPCGCGRFFSSLLVENSTL